ncbi:gametocyte-specific factor 1 homolog isoform X2 [Thrips palmi]|uniref:Gametocyte-specific factor 1 homolog isoform X2 n=1 Tax=Thrips palmi TaxID=161013 RepID=A0A6P9AMU9_THRPL|nr:gametocyte-specific factor 1 homolog isoform X2 [Thrips palmi]
MDIKEGLHNPYVMCPYNRAHEVPKLRLQRHLLKCRKYPHLSMMKTCPFNATHVVPQMELELHLMTCAERNLIEGQKYSLTATQGELGNPSYHPDVPVGDWSDESDEEDLHGPALRNNHRRNHHQVVRSVQEEDIDDGGALSQLEDSHVDPSPIGFGRGRIHRLVAEMNTRKP